jgi:hypothetical protein
MMVLSRRQKWHLALTITLSTIAISSGYELKAMAPTVASIPTQLFGIIVAMTFSPALAQKFLGIVFMWRPIRSIVFGESYLEGVWRLDSFMPDGSIRVGLSEIRYNVDTWEILVHAYFPKSLRADGPAFSHSLSAFIRESDMLYVNHFQSAASDGDRIGIAIGHFHPGAGGGSVVRYEGKVIFLDGSSALRQIGRKIGDSAVRSLLSKHGEEGWRDAAINDRILALSSKP